MMFYWVMWTLYAVAILASMAIAFGITRLQREIDDTLAHNRRTLCEINDTWLRCMDLNDRTMRLLKKIRAIQSEGEGWKNGGGG